MLECKNHSRWLFSG